MEYFDPLQGPRELTRKFNPNHDDKGRFAEAGNSKEREAGWGIEHAGVPTKQPMDSLDDPKAKPLTPEARDARINELQVKLAPKVSNWDVNSPHNATHRADMVELSALLKTRDSLDDPKAKVFHGNQAVEFDSKGHVKDSQGNTHETTENGMSHGTSTFTNQTPTEHERFTSANGGHGSATVPEGSWGREGTGSEEERSQMSSIGKDFKNRAPVNTTAEEEKLLHASVTKTVSLSEGGAMGDSSSVVKLLTLDDGSKAIFKPARGEHKDINPKIENGFPVEREVAAWQVAKLADMQDMVAPAVSREIGGQKGSMATFEAGTVAKNIGYGVREFGVGDDLPKAALFDYVVGNMDRHGGNWLVRDDGHLMLVDHNLTFPDKTLPDGKIPFWSSNHKFIGEAKRRSLFGSKEKIGPVSDYTEPYVKHRFEILEAARKAGLSSGSVASLDQRLENISHGKKWGDLISES